MNWFLRFIINAIVLYLIARYVPGFSGHPTAGQAVIAAIVFGLVNMFIGPVLRLISAPLTWLTHGLFSIVINYILFVITTYVAHSFYPNHGSISPWLANLYGAIIMMIVSTFVEHGSREEARRYS